MTICNAKEFEENQMKGGKSSSGKVWIASKEDSVIRLMRLQGYTIF